MCFPRAHNASLVKFFSVIYVERNRRGGAWAGPSSSKASSAYTVLSCSPLNIGPQFFRARRHVPDYKTCSLIPFCSLLSSTAHFTKSHSRCAGHSAAWSAINEKPHVIPSLPALCLPLPLQPLELQNTVHGRRNNLPPHWQVGDDPAHCFSHRPGEFQLPLNARFPHSSI